MGAVEGRAQEGRCVPDAADHSLSHDESPLYKRVYFGWITRLLRLGAQQQIEERDAMPHLNRADTSDTLDALLDRAGAPYAGAQGGRRSIGAGMVRAFAPKMALQFVFACAEIVVRIAGPIFLKEFLSWLQDDGEDGDKPPMAEGWLWGLLLTATSFGMMLCHHVLFYNGMRLGQRARIMAMSAIHSKVLRLNTAALAGVSTGQIVNLVSNDVRRFDDMGPFWPFVLVAPIELVVVLVLVALELGVAPAFVGVSAVLALIPIQGSLVRLLGRLRSRAAAVTDERVRLAGEAIAGALAVKFAAWEAPLARQLAGLRSKEHSVLRKRALIVATNFSVQFMIVPLVAFLTFTTARMVGKELSVPSVFYTMALLNLPRLWMAIFFVRSVETLTEGRIAVRRIDRFLSLPDAPAPNALKGGDAVDACAIRVPRCDFDWGEAAEVSTRGDAAEGKSAKGGRRTYAIGAAAGEAAAMSRRGRSKSAKSTASEDPWAAAASQRRANIGPVLKDIELTVARGELLGVCGPVGSGKSSLLAGLLGELPPAGDAPSPAVAGAVAYCSQNPWIVQGTLRENVLFGAAAPEAPRDAAAFEERYRAAVAASALPADIAALPDGDETELGERGINLSGGQKARLALARAAFSQTDVVLLDDPLSAVDPRVGATLFEKCIGGGGVMAGRTRVLVTHQRQYLPRCDRVLVLRGGRIAALGPYEEVRGAIEDAIAPTSATEKAAGTGAAADVADIAPEALTVDVLDDEKGGEDGKGSADEGDRSTDDTEGKTEGSDGGKGGSDSAGDKKLAKARTELVREEKTITGSVSWGVYWAFVVQMGLPGASVVLILLLAGQGLAMFHEVWLARWADAPPDEQDETWQIWGYGALTAGVVVASVLRSGLFFLLALGASTRLHDEMSMRVLRSPLEFFHTNPTGRVLNRFSKDQGIVDEQMPMVFFDSMQSGLLVVAAFGFVAVAVPFVLPTLLPLAAVFYFVRRRYLGASREVKRFEATTRSPVFAAFSAALKGLPVIRAYRAQPRFLRAFAAMLDLNASWWSCFIGTSRWIGFKLDLISGLVLLSCCCLTIALKSSVSSELVAVMVANVLQLSGLMQWAVRQTAELENHMTSTERMVEYANLPHEAKWVSEGARTPPEGWPGAGVIEYRGVSARYRAGLPLVLRDLTFTIPGGTSCGVVGRTGSGKSSLMLTLFRLIHITQGSMRIDGIDTATLGADALRRRISIIPQDPTLFSGTLRLNLDPFGAKGDDALWAALREVQMGEAAEAMGGLDAPVAEHGDNLSAGQRQLLCLARALLQDARIVCCDEMTSAVDGKTDALVGAALRRVSQARKCTMLVIAHRIDTVLDLDGLLVLSNGNLVERGVPKELAADPSTAFGGMVEAARKVREGKRGAL
ncbi:unnamed protein product [Pedinophyceae sp. YPF-701]|nr:unnamed protein product [Pedinophyceae sp. YPF-701]